MQFSVIYSADVPEDVDVMAYAPPQLNVWDETENGPSEYSYLEGEWENGTHRKWCAILSREQFDEFVTHCGLSAERTETMGSIGAPGFGFGWAPAISFVNDDAACIANAYVTPVPEVERASCDEWDWGRVRTALLSIYG